MCALAPIGDGVATAILSRVRWVAIGLFAGGLAFGVIWLLYEQQVSVNY